MHGIAVSCEDAPSLSFVVAGCSPHPGEG